MLKGIRKIPVKKTWTKFDIDRDWRRVPKGTPGPRGLRTCISVCKTLEPGEKVEGFGPKNGTRRHGHTGGFLARNFSKISWTASFTGQPRGSRGQTYD